MKRPRDPEKVFASRPHSVGFLVGVPLSFVVGSFLFFFVGRLCHIVSKKIKDKIIPFYNFEVSEDVYNHYKKLIE